MLGDEMSVHHKFIVMYEESCMQIFRKYWKMTYNLLFLLFSISVTAQSCEGLRWVSARERRNESEMAAARLELELSALTLIPERADVGDGPPKPPRRREGHWAAVNGLEGYYREHVKGKSKEASEERARPRTFP